jgi:hypothetical protein
MTSGWRKAITLIVVVVVIYVLISPLFVLDPSANRAWRAALQVMLSLAALVCFELTSLNPLVCLGWISEVLSSRGSPDVTIFSSVCLC